jgi:hypothetical protein
MTSSTAARFLAQLQEHRLLQQRLLMRPRPLRKYIYHNQPFHRVCHHEDTFREQCAAIGLDE